jgi:hypothetical protein
MKGSATFSCVLAGSLILAGTSVLAQRGEAGTIASPPLKALMLENEKKLGEVESLLNQLDTAEAVMEKDIQSLEKALLGYIYGMDKAYAAVRETAHKESMAKERKAFEDMAAAFETRLREINARHTALADKILNATIELDEAWLNKMIKEEREGYYRSLYPEGRQKVKQAHPELESEP